VLANNSQVDNAGIDVRLTQLRHLLAGTREFGPGNGEGFLNAAGNIVGNFVNSSTGPNAGRAPFAMPNGIADGFDQSATDPNLGAPFIYVTRTTPPVAGRWGEAQSVPGAPFPNPLSSATTPAYVNVVGTNGADLSAVVGNHVSNYANPVRA